MHSIVTWCGFVTCSITTGIGLKEKLEPTVTKSSCFWQTAEQKNPRNCSRNITPIRKWVELFEMRISYIVTCFSCRRPASSSVTKWAAYISHERFYLQPHRIRQEAHHKIGLGETPRRLIRKLNSADILHSRNLNAFDAAVHLSFAVFRTISEL